MDLMNSTPAQKTATIEAMNSREMQEVKAMVFMAKQFPRDENYALQRILKSCERKGLAERATYEYPRGDTKVTGPSIRLAEAIAQNWGNIDFGIVELEQRSGESSVMAYAWDLETNTRQAKVFTVPHIRSTKKGSYRLTDPRDIYEMVANNGARRLRACILGVIPGDVVEAAVEKCQETLAKSLGGKLEEVIKKMVVAFEKEYGVTKEMLEKFIGCKAEVFTPNDVVRLGNVFTSIKDGMGKPEDYFEDIKPTRSADEKSPFDEVSPEARKAESKTKPKTDKLNLGEADAKAK